MAGQPFTSQTLYPKPSRFSALRQFASLGTLVNLVLVGAWLYLFQPIFPYLKIIATRHDFRTNQIVLVGVVALLIIRTLDSGQRPDLSIFPQLVTLPLVLIMSSIVGFLLSERLLDVHTISATFFGIGTYGLFGLWLLPHRWKAGLPAALLLIAVLPFGAHMQTFIGYPVRLYTARVVETLLSAANIGTVGVDTILVFENGVSHIDSPCSGVKSLWTGGIFLLAATWIEQRRIDWRWVGIAVLFAIALLTGNLARVLILTVAGPVYGFTTFANVVHVPLGVLTFVLACLIALLALRWVPQQLGAVFRITPARPWWLGVGLIGAILLAALLHTPRDVQAINRASVAFVPPAALSITPLPLTAVEYDMLARDGADAVERWQFQWGDISGSMILIASDSWRAHHRPERCFEVYGLQISDSGTALVETNFPIRLVDLTTPDTTETLRAVYWFQSPTQVTDDYATRIWADLAPEREDWMLTSILFDDATTVTEDDYNALYLALQESIATYLQQQS